VTNTLTYIRSSSLLRLRLSISPKATVDVARRRSSIAKRDPRISIC